MKKLAAGLVLVAWALSGCSDDGSGDEVARLEEQVEKLEADLAQAEEELEDASDPNGVDKGESVACDISAGEDLAAQLASECVPTCAAALTFANASTNPAMNDALSYEVAYIRLTDADGVEPAPDETIAWGESSIEVASVSIDRTDPNVPSVGAWYTRWGPTGVSPAQTDNSYEVHWFVDEQEIELGSDDGWLEVRHPLRETAQFIDTPIGCFPNPHRADDAADRDSAPITTTTTVITTTTVAPTTTAAAALQDRHAAALRAIGDEISAPLDRYECEQVGPSQLECYFSTTDGFTTIAQVWVNDDGTLRYEVEFQGGGM